MALPLIPKSLEHLTKRPFSFYPPVLNVTHNEWLLRETTWSEVLVVNEKSGISVWIPRRYVGEVSKVDEPVLIVGLNKELEYKAGTVWPHERRVIEIPRGGHSTPGDLFASSSPVIQTAPAGLRSGPGPEGRVGRLIAVTLLLGVLGAFLAVSLYRSGFTRPQARSTATDEAYLDLKRSDDYHSVVRKLGAPTEERWRSQSGELQYRALWYPERSYSVILMGTGRDETRYIGTVDSNWRMVHYVELASGGTTASLLRSLPRF